MNLRVQCYAGRKADERPVRFQLGNRDYLVEEVVDQWYGPDDTFYKVRADDGNLYILRHSTADDEWKLESFSRPFHDLSTEGREEPQEAPRRAGGCTIDGG